MLCCQIFLYQVRNNMFMYLLTDLEVQVLNSSSITVTEGPTNVCFKIRLNRAIGRDVSINMSTSMGTASESL